MHPRACVCVFSYIHCVHPSHTLRFVNKFTRMFEKQTKDYKNGTKMTCETCAFNWVRPDDATDKPCPKCFTPGTCMLMLCAV
jgi:rubrerythrin